MKRKTIIRVSAIILAAFLMAPPAVWAQTHVMNQELGRNLNLMAGMMTDIDLLIGSGNITLQQRQQIMKIMGEMGGVMQEIGSAKEIEGWRQMKERRRLNLLRKQLDGLKKQIHVR